MRFKVIKLLFILLLVSFKLTAQVNLTSGLIAYYPFNGNANDAIGNNINGTINGATLTSDRFGNATGAYAFNGSSSYISLPYSSFYDFAPSGQFSISVWVQPDVNSAYSAQGLIIKSPYNANYFLSNWNYGMYLFNYKEMTGWTSNNFLNGTTTLQTNQCWYNLVITYNNGKWNLYVNGTKEASDVTQTKFILQDGAASTIAFGRKGEASGDYYKGKMDEVRMYNRELNTAEVIALYNDGSNPCNTSAVYPAFTAPDTVCLNAPVTFNNTSIGASSYYWNFCSANANAMPSGTMLGNVSNVLSIPVFMEYASQKGNYYGFMVNNSPGSLVRLDFGNSLLNTPTAVDLGNFGGIISNSSQGIQLVQSNGNWYALIVGGDSSGSNTPSRILKIDFGSSLNNNSPVATNWGNVNNSLNYPTDLYVFQSGTTWVGLTVNYRDNTVTRFNFGTDFMGTPTAVNLGNIGNLNQPSGIFPINDNGTWRVFVTNFGSNTLSRIDFGNSLLNAPNAAVNLGNIGGLLNTPRDLYIFNYCSEIIGYLVNDVSGDMVRMNFSSLTATPAVTSLGIIGGATNPHSISKVFRVGDDLFTFLPNSYTNTLSRVRFSGCTSSSVPNSSLQNPPAISYNTAGTYTISLTIDDGLATQSSYCKQIVVVGNPAFDFSYTENVCAPKTLNFSSVVASGTVNAYQWDFGNNIINTISIAPTVTYANYGTYNVKLTMQNNYCVDSIVKLIPVSVMQSDIITGKDTAICAGNSIQLNASTSGLNYCWSPSAGLSNATIANPVANPTTTTTYYLNSQIIGTNLIVNGDFSQGNVGFTSDYGYEPPQNLNEGKYWVGTNPNAWNPGMSVCKDHTGSSGNGNMLLVNGSPNINENVWKQTITVTPNTNYAFSVWIQSVSSPNPALLKFSINKTVLANAINASPTTCSWQQFYTTWNSGNNTTATISIVNLNPIYYGNYFALDDISFSPVNIQQDSVKVSVVASPPVKTGNDTAVCAGTSLQLQAIGASFYNWYPSNLVSDSTAANPITYPKVNSQFIVRGYNTFGCYGSDTINVTAKPLPAINTTTDTSICIGNTLQLNTRGGLVYSWTPITDLNNANIANPVASPVKTTKYFVTGTGANNCIATDSIVITVIPQPVFSIKPLIGEICIGDSTVLTAAGGQIYQWQPVGNISVTTASFTKVYPTVNTVYTVNVTDTICSVSTTLSSNIIVNPKPSLTITKSNDLDCFTTQSKLNVVSSGIYYTWLPAATLSNANIANPVAKPQTTTTYQVTVTDKKGCSNKDTIQVKLITTGVQNDYLMPTAFTPNNDGLNDCFGIKLWGIVTELQFSIFNRWGERIYYSTNPSACWDGNYKGMQQSAGTYIYQINAKTQCGNVFRKGAFVLIR